MNNVNLVEKLNKYCVKESVPELIKGIQENNLEVTVDIMPLKKTWMPGLFVLLFGIFAINAFYVKNYVQAWIRLVVSFLALVTMTIIGTALDEELFVSAESQQIAMYILCGLIPVYLGMFVWMIVDLFLDPKRVRKLNTEKIQNLIDIEKSKK